MTPRDGVNGSFLEIQEEIKMEYEKGYVFDLMEQGGPTDVREPYFREPLIYKDSGTQQYYKKQRKMAHR